MSLTSLVPAQERVSELRDAAVEMARIQLPPTVLVVDDEPFIRQLIMRTLGERGCACAPASCVAEAVEVADRLGPDLVVTDVKMPGQSGLELLMTLHERLPDTPVIIVTGFNTADTAQQALVNGAFGYLTKPLEKEVLIHQAICGLEHRRLVIANRERTQGLERQLQDHQRQLRLAQEETVQRLVLAASLRDVETGAHVRRVGLLSAELARLAGWNSLQVDELRLAAPMHDVGKLGVPDQILHKPDRLTDAETTIMQSHTILGARLLANPLSSVLQLAQEIALCHHERFDGYGYPRRLAGVEIPESARIVTIADAFDACSHDRVYRRALPEREVAQRLRNGRGSQFDPHLLDLFLGNLQCMRDIAAAHPDEEIV